VSDQQLRQNIEAVTRDRRLTNYLRDWLRKLRTDVVVLQDNSLPSGTTDGSILAWDGSEWIERLEVIVLDGSISFRLSGVDLFRVDSDSRLKAISGAFQEDDYTIPDSATPPIDPANGSMQIWNMAQNATPSFTNFANGDAITLHIDDGSGYTITWPATIRWIGGAEPTLDTTDRNIIVLWQAGGVIYGSFAGVASTA
jgi:hypothetical protein